MRSVRKILLVRTADEPFDKAFYVVHRLIEHWRALSLEVQVTDRLAEPTGHDVLVFPHIDLTRTPPALARQLDRCARVINRSVIDISKRAISRQLVRRPGDHEGPVIVKTDRNCGGLPESRAAARRGWMPALTRRIEARLPWSVSGLVGKQGYRIYDHSRQVPSTVWMNPRLVVEKFLPEREGGFYALRQYVFLGPCEISSRSVSADPLVKADNVIRREILDEVPQSVRDFRKALGFDYGKFDYAMHGEEAIVFDVNRTPTYDPSSKAGSASSLIASLAPGIEPFLGGA